MPLTVGVVIRDPVGPRQLLNVCGSEKRCPIFEKVFRQLFRDLSLLELSKAPQWRASVPPGLIPREAPLASPSRVVRSSILHVFPGLPVAVLSDFCQDF